MNFSDSELEAKFDEMWDELYSEMRGRIGDVEMREQDNLGQKVKIRWKNYPVRSCLIEHDGYGFVYDAFGKAWRESEADKLAERFEEHFSE